MTARFTVLASGSSGNAAFLAHRGFGLLVDCGIGPRALSDRLSAAGAKWADVSAVVLTHTHGDHWKGLTLGRMQRERVPLVLHADHAKYLSVASPEYTGLAKAGLVRTFRDGEAFALTDGLTCLPVRVPHDSDPTFAFRIDGTESESNRGWSLGYASDLGQVPDALARAFRTVDVLALEFNHDVEMQRRSQRPPDLVARVLGHLGHLSNRQAANFVRSNLRDRPVPLRALYQLHLSRECNVADLARAAADGAIVGCSARPFIVTARQDVPTPPREIAARELESRDRPPAPSLAVSFQAALPGLN